MLVTAYNDVGDSDMLVAEILWGFVFRMLVLEADTEWKMMLVTKPTKLIVTNI